MMDRLHHYIRELRLLRKTMEAVKKQNRSFDDGKNGSSEERKAVEEEIATLKSRIQSLESECAAKTDEMNAAESKSEALKKQSEGLLLEYDRLLEDNQSLRSQLHEIANTDGKKSM
ncbi:B-cell receptor-associated protein 31 [Bienertia sinuspersici]